MSIYQIAAGRTPPGATDWRQYSSPDGIYVEVDTSAAGFQRTVIYTTSLAGENAHWMTTGGSCIYSPTNKGFKVYVRFTKGPITPQNANAWKWHVNWVGVEIDNPEG